MPFKVEEASTGSLAHFFHDLEPVSATFAISVAGPELVKLRRLGKGSALAALENAIDDFLALEGNRAIFEAVPMDQEAV